LRLDPLELHKFKQQVLTEYPNEAAAVIVNGKHIPCVNKSSDPTRHGYLDAEQLLQIELHHGPIQAFLHSHPIDPTHPSKWPAFWPSGVDMENWLAGSIPWGIVATEGENITEPVWLDESEIAPLEGRTFVHGIHDCYSLVRDYYRLQGINLPNYARGMEWWERGQDLYVQNFKAAGFEEISRSDVRVGDAAIMKVRASVYNHAGVVVKTNEILHHLYGRLSGRDRLDKWDRFCKYLRYTGKQQQ
jgi:proteasome lid subunit RPN8/RPN11